MKVISAKGTKVVPASYLNEGRAIYRSATRIERGNNSDPKGTSRQSSAYISPQRCIGDIMWMFGEENGIPYVAWKGGEGGRGWKVRSTIC